MAQVAPTGSPPRLEADPLLPASPDAAEQGRAEQQPVGWPAEEASDAPGPAELPQEAPRPDPLASATPAQRRAVEARGCDVVVAAGAGSGKTFVLVERFMALVREGASPERLLTITFTDKAAREMAERIARALAGLGVADARRAAEGAWISTIHGFCARLLRERALEAGVDPAFAVLTDVPAARVRRQAFLAAQRSFRAAHPGLYDGLIERVRWGKDRDGARSIARCVMDLHDQMRAAGAELRALAPGEEPELDALAHGWSGEGRSSGGGSGEVAGVRLAFEALAAATQQLMVAVAALRSGQTGSGGRGGVSPRLAQRLALVGERAQRIAATPLDTFRLPLHRELRTLAEQARGGGALAGELEAVRAAAEGAARAYAEGPARALGRALEDLLFRFDQAFRALKAERSALDFTDLEERARELLERRPDVREEVQRRFDAVLVDEFQDTSRLQQRLVDLVRRPRALFAVGDVKQSIYGFRHAEVRGLLETTAEVLLQGGEVIDLDLSFRTRPELLAYVDEVFERAWGEPGSEVPHQVLRPGVEFAAVSQPCVELLLGRGERLAAARLQEARAVAARLATLIEGGALRGTNPLRKDVFERPLRYKDCAILLPATTHLHLYESALRARGVPYRVASGRGFYQSREVIDAVCLLEVCADAHDDLALLAFLRSPAVGLSDDGLAALAALRDGPSEEAPPGEQPPGAGGAAGGGPGGGAAPKAGAKASLFSSLERVALERGALPGASPRDGRRALRALGLVRGLRAQRGRRSTREILAHGLEESGLLDGSLLRSGDVRGFANLKKLLEVVDDLEREGTHGPGAIAAVLRDLRLSEARESEASVSSDDEDAVSVLTVHAAKGLEWPLVVVGDAGRYAPREDEPVVWSPPAGSSSGGKSGRRAAGARGGGVSLVLRDPADERASITPATLARVAEEGRERRREESKRLLYVAMTRARDHLIVAGAQRSGARSAGDWLAWSRAPVRFETACLRREADPAVGGSARIHPTLGGVLVRTVEVLEEHEGSPMVGPRGPAASAQPLLDARGCEDLALGRRPRLRRPLRPLPRGLAGAQAASSGLGARQGAEPAHAEPAHAEPAHAEPAHAEPAHAEPAHAEPAHAEPARAEPAHAEPAHAEPARAQPARAEPERAEPEHAEPEHAEPEHAEPEHAEPEHADRLPEPREEELLPRARALLASARSGAEEVDYGASVYTVSEVLTWRVCPRRALYEHVLGDERRGEGEGAALAPEPGWEREGRAAGLIAPDLRGTLAHEVLARAMTGGLPPASTIEARAAQLLLPDRDGRACAETARWTLELAGAFLQGPLGRRARETPGTQVERPFLARIPLAEPEGPSAAGFLLRGTVDLLVPGERGWLLVDHKASDLTALEIPSRLEEHAAQLAFYALALETMGEPVEAAWVSYLVPGVLERVPVDARALGGAREALGDFAQARRELDLPPRPGKACSYCPWWDLCPEGARPSLLASPSAPRRGGRPESGTPSHEGWALRR
ncbi:MAG: UvrD-helicase domain-containing protein [Planctomycetota bacterium]